MNQKQTIIAVMVVAVAILLFVLMYQYQNQDGASVSVPQNRSTGEEESAAVPTTVDDITDAILDETTFDQEVLAAEASAEAAELESQNQTVNDLGNAYDENSY